MADYEVTTDIIPEQTVVIPQQIKLPELRYAAPTGTLAQGDSIEGYFILKDKDGNEKSLDMKSFKVVLSDWPSDESKEILGIFYLNFVISNKAL
jgi:hypothetical protein